MIRVSNLTKRYGNLTAIEDLSFEIERGEIVGFLGPNGAGKTTTMRILSCFLPATSGTVTIGGLDVLRDSLEIRRMIGYLPENVPLYPEMRVEEYLRFRAALRGVHGKKRRLRVDEVMSLCDIRDVRRQLVGHLSKGYRQRVGLADCLVHDPRLLILDEPTLGLDPNQIRHVRNLIKHLAGNHTVLLSTHMLTEAEMACSRVLIIKKGRIVASDKPERLAQRMKGTTHIVVEVQGPYETILERLRCLHFVAGVTGQQDGEWGHFILDGSNDTDVRAEVFKLSVANGWLLRELHGERKSLEDIFVAVTDEAQVS